MDRGLGSLRLLLIAADASNIMVHLKRAWLGTTPNLARIIIVCSKKLTLLRDAL
jgi:1,2-phenylacetyl-CoA epoxidase catalytic subunit